MVNAQEGQYGPYRFAGDAAPVAGLAGTMGNLMGACSRVPYSRLTSPGLHQGGPAGPWRAETRSRGCPGRGWTWTVVHLPATTWILFTRPIENVRPRLDTVNVDLVVSSRGSRGPGRVGTPDTPPWRGRDLAAADYVKCGSSMLGTRRNLGFIYRPPRPPRSFLVFFLRLWIKVKPLNL